ncbi:hypothetical protein M3Y96_01257000 [Aphelenchoides besseyi]|nr:hypothetical protein M3Y96_01257000 [Aphelenchoides besseyi]
MATPWLRQRTVQQTKQREKANRKSLNNSIDEPNTKESEDVEERGENENATVYVSRNPSYLSLSTCNYDQTLIDYLQSHPLTKTTPKLTRAAQKEAEKVKTSLSELLELNLPRDCLISPMYTPDELLRELPTCRFIVSERF